MRLTIFTKMLGAALGAGMLMLVAISVFVFSLGSIQSNVSNLVDRQMTIARSALTLKSSVDKARQIVACAQVTDDAGSVSELKELSAGITSDAETILKAATIIENKRDAEALLQTSGDYFSNAESLVREAGSLGRQTRFDAARTAATRGVAVLLAKETTYGERMELLADSISNRAAALSAEKRTSVLGLISSLRTSALAIVLVALLIGVSMVTILARSFSKNVNSLKDAAKAVAAGNADVSVSVTSKDEIADLTESFNLMTGKIKSSMSEISEKLAMSRQATEESLRTREEAESSREYLSMAVEQFLVEMEKFKTGDLTVALTSRRDDDIGRVYNGFTKAVENIRSLMERVQGSIEATASASAQISTSAEELSAGAQELSAQAQETAAAVEEMSRTIAENAKNASESASLASSNGESAMEGKRVVEDTTAKMKEIAEAVTRSASTIEKLGGASEKIGDIVSVIKDIADQTNLLALNAAIEAARAGEQGRGFSVVADEVRKLAERTSAATKEIAGMIKSVQQETAEAVREMGIGRKEVEQGIKLAEKARESLDKIVSATQSAVDMVNGIAAASEEQSSTSELISKNVESISAVSAQSAAGVSQIAKGVDDLTRLTEGLRSLALSFKMINGSKTSRNGNNDSFFDLENLARVKTSHRIWKSRLESYVKGQIELDSSTALDDRSCDLGKWYYSAHASGHGTSPAFEELGKWHSDFHETAGEIMRLCDSNECANATRKLSELEEYMKHIAQLLDMLRRETAPERAHS